MLIEDLRKYVGKRVYIYFKGEEKGIYGRLGYADEFSAKHDYRKPGYFYIFNFNTCFKASIVRKVIEEEKPC